MQSSAHRLTFLEREEIARLAGTHTVTQIAGIIGRDKSTISRELARNTTAGQPYRASTAQAAAQQRARRPKHAKLAVQARLHDEVQRRLTLNQSPEQIAARLRVDFPNDPEMWVSHETIYQSLYVQGRGALRRELATCLRTGRTLRKPRRPPGQPRNRIPGMINISQRPPAVEDRAVPGHWEGDLIVGADNGSQIGTLVERTTGFVMLLHLPEGRDAATVAEAMIAKMGQLPEQLRLTLTWDQGREMSNHVQIAAATDLEIYFCDPHSPWQRGSNENTNGLLRQYFPKGTDLSFWGPGYLDIVAAELNDRPRKRHQWRTPAEVMEDVLSGTYQPPGVAPTD